MYSNILYIAVFTMGYFQMQDYFIQVYLFISLSQLF